MNNKTMGKDIANPIQREQFIKDNADACENKGYMKAYTPEELQGHKEKLANVSIEISEIENEYAERLKPLKEARENMVSNIKAKAEYVNEICYRFTDRDAKMTEYYNRDGDLVEMRPATAEELQPTLFMNAQYMNTEKMNINLAPGMNEIIIREGAAPKVLDPKAPVKMNINGTIGAPVEFLKKRINAGQFEQKNCHIIVDREKITIELVVNESDEYTRGTIKGTLQFHPKFIEFGINTGKVWSPFDFSMFCKMNRAFFADKNVNMTLVSACKNFTATVNNAIERSIKENGDRTDNFAQVVNSNLPESFTLSIPVFKGGDKENLEVETFAKIDGRNVAFVLMSPGAEETLETLRDTAIDKELEAIKEIAPEIAIIEI